MVARCMLTHPGQRITHHAHVAGLARLCERMPGGNPVDAVFGIRFVRVQRLLDASVGDDGGHPCCGARGQPPIQACGRPVTLLWFRSERGRLRVGAHPVDRHMLPHHVGAFHVHGRPRRTGTDGPAARGRRSPRAWAWNRRPAGGGRSYAARDPDSRRQGASSAGTDRFDRRRPPSSRGGFRGSRSGEPPPRGRCAGSRSRAVAGTPNARGGRRGSWGIMETR